MHRMPNKMDKFRIDETNDAEVEISTKSIDAALKLAVEAEPKNALKETLMVAKSGVEKSKEPDIISEIKIKGFIPKVAVTSDGSMPQADDGVSKSYYNMVEFTKILTQPMTELKEEMENVDEPKEELKVEESNPDCACVCHPQKHSCDDDGECKCKALSIVSLQKALTLKEIQWDDTKAQDKVPLEQDESPEPGLPTEDVQLLSSEMEPLEDLMDQNVNDEAPIVLVPNPPEPQMGPIILLPRPLFDEQRECLCYMRRLKPEEIIATPLDPIVEVSTENSQVVIVEKNITPIEVEAEPVQEPLEKLKVEPVQEPVEELKVEPETIKCQENCACSCHLNGEVHFERGVLKPVEPEKPPQAKCVELCALHCPEGRHTSIPLVAAADSLIIAAKRVSSSEKFKEKFNSDLGAKSEGAATGNKEGRQSLIKRLSNSLRRSK